MTPSSFSLPSMEAGTTCTASVRPTEATATPAASATGLIGVSTGVGATPAQEESSLSTLQASSWLSGSATAPDTPFAQLNPIVPSPTQLSLPSRATTVRSGVHLHR
ncbi:hypothetical protein DVH05_006734 [Phytophthora capsici]|nr:hypothetical protein DVH05_010948 [Phytophthora capsici]KAG1703719.1 hypothetical protein DVH05_006734 [Phytophthora capsici]